MTRRLILFAIPLCSLRLFAADEPLPKAETIMDRFIEVTGGKAAYDKRKNKVSTGTIEMAAMNLKGSMTRYSAAPDKSYVSMELDGVGKIEQGTTANVAWQKDVMQGARVKSGEEKAQAIREGVFNAPVNWKKMFPKAETTGVETIDGEVCYKVVLTPADGKPETTYYQKKSGLAVKTVATAASPMGDVEVEVDVSDYKDFDGVLMPTKMVQKFAGQEMAMTVQTVKINQEIPAERFDPPAEIKALLDKATPEKK
jgi:zinc protease